MVDTIGHVPSGTLTHSTTVEARESGVSVGRISICIGLHGSLALLRSSRTDPSPARVASVRAPGRTTTANLLISDLHLGTGDADEEFGDHKAEVIRSGRSEYAARRLGVRSDDLVPSRVAQVSLALTLTAYEQWLRDPRSSISQLLDQAMAALAAHLGPAPVSR